MTRSKLLQVAFLQAALAGGLATAPRSSAGQEMGPDQAAPDQAAPAPAPEGTYADPGAERLVRRARAARSAHAQDLHGFELTFRERIYVGLKREGARRERALFHRERAARVHWRRGGHRVIRWLGVRRGVPLLGIAVEPEEMPAEDAAFDTKFDFLDPAGDRVLLGARWALHPLADSAHLHYRFGSGDTLRIRLPGLDRRVTLVELTVRPRRARFDRIVGSLWFDEEAALLVRAIYRPAASFDFRRQRRKDARRVPAILGPIQASAEYITVDYGLHELRWWLPNRVAFEGTATIGALGRMPMRVEWTFGEYEVDGPGAAEVVTDSGPRIAVRIPPRDSLRSAPELPEPLFSGSVQAFTGRELEELRARLGGLGAPAPALPAPHLAWGMSPGLLRFNRVEGLSTGTRLSIPTGAAARFEAAVRIGIPEWEPGAELRWARETVGSTVAVAAFRRLTDPGDWGRPLDFGNSLNALLLGTDYGLYFRETGLELSSGRTGSRARIEGRLFAARHQDAPKTTDASLPRALGDRVFPENLAAERGDVVGVSGRIRAFSGVDPTAPVVSGSVWGEAAAGDFDYGRLAASGALVAPLRARLTGALEVAAGTTLGGPPRQRLWYLGGPYTLRGFEVAAAAGEAFWLARAELGLGFRVSRFEEPPGGSALRAVLFADAGWAGPRDAFGSGSSRLGVGGGLSFLDGLLRLDLARGVRGGNGWRLYLYADGLR